MVDYEYIGDELDLFANARNWKSYLRDMISPHLGDTVLEVGAGIGGTTSVFASEAHSKWLCLEPDPQLANKLDDAINNHALPGCCEARVGTLNSLPDDEHFDSIIYIDVLEHIERDHEEFQHAATHLKDEGNLVILCPAHNFLFSPFDKSVGHFRRYNKSMFRKLNAKGVQPVRLVYLDSAGMAASLANKYLMKQSMPTRSQIEFWDSVIVPISRRLTDPLLFRTIGKSILGVWQRSAAN